MTSAIIGTDIDKISEVNETLVFETEPKNWMDSVLVCKFETSPLKAESKVSLSVSEVETKDKKTRSQSQK